MQYKHINKKLNLFFLFFLSLLAILLPAHTSAQEADGQSTENQVASVEPPGEEPPVEKKLRVDAYRSVEGLENWHYDYDISGYDEGKYNIIIQGTDRAGNIYIEGPFNILIDPESDLPIVNISNPMPSMRVGGNLNIVGTCIDDDAVAKVEVKIGEGQFEEAQGTDFWSFYLDTTDFDDGQYTITARGIDINGKMGNEYIVAFNLDKVKPINALTSHENGALVSGKLTLEGVVSDLNGIDSLFYSADGGDTFLNLDFKKDKEAKEVTFQLKIDTTKLPDGPQIYWIRSTDKTGSVGLAAFLFFVDNKPAEIQFLYPTPDDQVNGRFYVSGVVDDEIGVATLTWKFGKGEPQDIILAPGNPYWVQEFDFTGLSKASVEFTIIDKAGNIRIEKLDLSLDHEGDMPVAEVIYPMPDEVVFEDRISGFVRDDDGVQGIVVSIDGGEDLSFDTGQAFNIMLDPLSSGQHKIEFFAVDVNGVESEIQRFSFTKSLEAPVIRLDSLVSSDGEQVAFQPGMEIDIRTNTNLTGTISFRNPVGSAEYFFGKDEPKKITLKKSDIPGDYNFTIPIDKIQIPYGIVDLSVRATDSLERDAELTTYMFVRNLTRNHENHGIYFEDERLQAGSSLVITRDSPLLGRYIGYSADSIIFEPEVDTISVFEKDGFIEISPTSEGPNQRALLRVTSDRGTVFSTQTFEFVTDRTAPNVKIDTSVLSGRLRGSVSLKGTVTDNVNPKSAAYFLNENRFTLQLTEEEEQHTYSSSISSGRFPDGGVLLSVVVEDDAGNVAKDYRIFNNTPAFVADPEATKDPVPVVSIIYPADGSLVMPDDLVAGKVYVAGIVSGVPKVSSISYSLDDGELRSASGGDIFEFKFPDLSPGRHTISIRATSDKEVESKQVRAVFTIVGPVGAVSLERVPESDSQIPFKPGMDIPLGDKTSIVSFVSGSSNIAEVTYSIDQGEPVKGRVIVDETGNRGVTVPLAKGLGFGRHTLTVHATDEFERSFAKSSFFYAVQPVGERQVPEKEGVFIADSRFNAAAGALVRLAKGESIFGHFNGRDIAEVRIEPATEHISVSYKNDLLTLRASSDGYAEDISLTVITIDGDIFTDGPFNVIIDAEAPKIQLDSEITGLWIKDTIFVKGNLSDNLAIEKVEMSIGIESGFTLLDIGPAVGMQTFPFDFGLPVGSTPDGNVPVKIRVTDSAGNAATEHILVRKDSESPKIRQIAPAAADAVNGFITVSGLIQDTGLYKSIEYSDDGRTYVPVMGSGLFYSDIDLASYEVLPEMFYYRVVDQSGNESIFSPTLNLDLESDKPVVQIQIPEEGILIRNDFVISGMVFDDDAVKAIHYRLDNEEFTELEGSNNFEIAIKLDDITDNEHVIEVKAEDLGGVMSEVATSWFKVSKEEPVSLMNAPSLDTTVKDTVIIEGESFDANGIKEVFISFDNGNTFNRVVGTEQWSYSLETQTMQDGTYSLLIRAVDNTDVTGLYTTLINIDNTEPMVDITGPFNGQQVADSLLLEGRADDSIEVTGLYVEIAAIAAATTLVEVEPPNDGTETGAVEDAEVAADEVVENEKAADVIPEDANVDEAGTGSDTIPNTETVIRFDLDIEDVILENIDVSSLPPGWYNVRITAKDGADNVGYNARNFQKIAAVQYSRIDILFPAQGEGLSGQFSLQGHIETGKIPSKVAVYLDGELYEAAETNQHGYFASEFSPERLQEGIHDIYVEAKLADGSIIETKARRIQYYREGPWVVIDNFKAGDFITQRPWLEGKAGYYMVPAQSYEADEPAEDKKTASLRDVQRIEVSLDNGRTFNPAQGGEEWRFRLETQDFPDGLLNILVRAVFKDERTAVAKTQLLVDDTSPRVDLIFPEEGMRFNDSIALIGTAFDTNGLEDISVSVRKGDKNQYEVPTFIQGLYIDTHFLGATYWEAGAGLTFFDDNVKLQFSLGMSPPGRFNGFVIGAKLLANIATLPYGFFFGPDWNFLSSSFAIGASFSYFTMSENTLAFTDEGLVLGAVIGQIEIARFEVLNWSMFNAFSLYTEAQLWFISSDVEAGVAFRMAFGLRSEVF